MRSSSNLGRFIRECRASLGYTSRQVEELSRTRPGLSPISHSNLLAMEKGSHVPTFDKLLTLAEILNVPTHRFEDRLKRDMLQQLESNASKDVAELWNDAQTALSERSYLAALGSLGRIVSLLQNPSAAPLDPSQLELLAKARLHAANCYARLGLLRVAKEDLEDLLASSGTPEPIVGRATYLLAELQRELGNPRLALIYAQAALDAADPGDTELRAKTLNAVGNLLDLRGDGRGAVERYEAALELLSARGDRHGVALVSRNLGTAYLALGDRSQGMRHLEAGLAAAEQGGDRIGQAYGLVNLARVRFEAGEPDAARDLARRAREIAQTEGLPDVLFSALYYLWKVAEAQQEAPLVSALRERLRALYRKLETKTHEAQQWAAATERPKGRAS